MVGLSSRISPSVSRLVAGLFRDLVFFIVFGVGGCMRCDALRRMDHSERLELLKTNLVLFLKGVWQRVIAQRGEARRSRDKFSR